MNADYDALLCDMAETYGIYDLRALPVATLATLVSGLGQGSRIRRKVAGINAPLDTVLLACIVDRLALLIWQNTKDGSKGRNRPRGFADVFVEKEKEVIGFDSAAEFEAALKRFG